MRGTALQILHPDPFKWHQEDRLPTYMQHAFCRPPLNNSVSLDGLYCRVEAAVIAALLHDTVDDTRVSLEEIYDDFGARVAQIVGQVGQLSTTTQLLRRRRRTDVSHSISFTPFQCAGNSTSCAI